MSDVLIDALTDSYVGEARAAASFRARLRAEAMADQVAAAEADAVATLRHVVRSMNDVLAALRRGESAWRSAVYAGDAAYAVADDAIRVTGYRRWAESARLIAAEAESFEASGRPVPGVEELRHGIDMTTPLDRPDVRLIDLPRVGLETDPATLRVRPLAEWLAEHPESAERVRDDEDARPLSEYLSSRGSWATAGAAGWRGR